MAFLELLEEGFEVSKAHAMPFSISSLCLVLVSQDVISQLLPTAVFFIVMVMDSLPLKL